MGMPGPMAPPPPMPPFGADTLEAQKQYRQRKVEYQEARKWDEACLIVFGSLLMLACASLLLFPLYLVFGLNGPLGAITIGGLTAVAVAEVHKRL